MKMWNGYTDTYFDPGWGRLRWRGVCSGEQRDGSSLSMEEDFALNRRRQVNVVILGHSFMRHLNEDIQRRKGIYHNLGLSFDVANVSWIYRGGMSIDEACYYYLYKVLELKPDVVFVQIGTCDADKEYYSYREVGDGIRHLGNLLVYHGVKKVMFGEILHRLPKGIPYEVPEFNYKVDNINQYLQVQFDEQYSHHISLWRHKAFWCCRKSVHFRDGIHLNRLGNLRMYRSVRAAVIKSIWLIMEDL